MSKVEIKLNTAEVGRLLRSDDVGNYLSEVAQTVQTRCGDGYDVDDYAAPTRRVASVFTADTNAMKDNLKNNTLLKAVST